MSRFRDDFAMAFEQDVLFERGDPIEVHPLGGDSRSITAVVNEKTVMVGTGTIHETQVTTLEVDCLKSAIPAPREGDYVEWEGESWDFSRQLSDEGGVLRLQYVKTQITQAGKKPSQL